MVGNFCCSAAADETKCKGDDKWKYAGMVVKDKVWSSCLFFFFFLFEILSLFFKEFDNLLIAGTVTTSGENKTVPYTIAKGDGKNSTQELSLKIKYSG